MSIGAAAYLEVQWIEMFYNTTQSSADSSTCGTVCAADSLAEVGTPKVLHSSGAVSRWRGYSRTCVWLEVALVTWLLSS